MAKHLTAEKLIESVKRRASIPENQVTFTTDDFLEFANEEMQIGLVPSILSLHEDHFMFTEEIPLVDSTARYTIPYRAIGSKLRELSFRDTNGQIYEMTRIGIGQRAGFMNNVAGDRIYSYYVENDEIVLVPDTTNISANRGNLVFTYYLRPNELVTINNTAVVTGINTTTGEITVDKIPSGFTTESEMDFVKTKSPHRTLTIDKIPSVVNSTTNTLTFSTSDIPSRLEVGDNVNLSGESNIPQVPTDLHVVLAHRVAARCLESLGDTQGLQNANAKLAEMENKTGNIIDNRVEDSPAKIVNRHGTLATGLYRKNYKNRRR